MTVTTDDLVKRLRRVSINLGIPSTTTLDSKVVAQAADRIEALERRVKALQCWLIEASALMTEDHAMIAQVDGENAILEAENARLWEAMIAEPTDKMLASACLSYRHDFGLLEGERRRELMVMARDWWRACAKEMQDRATLAELTRGKDD